MSLELARVALILAPDDPYASWYREVLEHWGIPHELGNHETFKKRFDYDVLILAGVSEVPYGFDRLLGEYVEKGGAILVSGSTWGLDRLLGVTPRAGGARPASETLSPVSPTDRAWPTGAPSAKSLGGVYVDATDSQVLVTFSNGTAAATRKPRAYYFAPHVGTTCALFQMGRSIECDGIGPNDGTAILDDGCLTADDGIPFSFEQDRETTPECSTPFFGTPHADLVKEIFIRQVIETIESTEKRFVIYWPWPDNADGVACLTVDCPEFSTEGFSNLANLCSMIGCPASWIVGHPGYGLDTYRTIRRADHELGLLASAEGGGSAEERLKILHVALARASGFASLPVVRFEGGAWHGYDHLYEVAETAGCKISVAKGGRHPGTSGFTFGTCHPFFPQRRDGMSRKVMELPYVGFQPGVVTPETALPTLAERVATRHGCLHVAVQTDLSRSQAASVGIRGFVTAARQFRLETVLAGSLQIRERLRRTLRQSSWFDAPRAGIKLIAEDDLDGLTLLFLGGGAQATAKGFKTATQTVQRLGATWTAATVDLGSKTPLEVVFDLSDAGVRAA
ncbi:MAG TPA: hypothetical protein PLH94_02120 [Fimbriimonadaceae bacterium]|nr:hypothetical protein [Fimbriimonadaceae bacterium]